MDRPSTYSPFFRRFGQSERDREMQETAALYQSVKVRQDAFDTSLEEFSEIIAYAFEREYSGVTAQPFAKAARAIAGMEALIWELPGPDFHKMNLKEFTEYRALLGAKLHFFANREELFELFYQALYGTLDSVACALPKLEDPSPFTIPLVYALPAPRDHVERMLGTLVQCVDKGLFKDLCETLYGNLCRASGRAPEDRDSKKPLILPSQSTLPLDQLVKAYLGHTPLYELFMAPVPLRLTHEDRFNHWHVLAGSGQGKTVLIENVIRYDLASDDPPSIVLIDPHSDLVRKLVRSDLGIEERIILIDPRDTKHPVALNPFAVNRERFDNYDEATREQVTAGVIQTFGFLWNGLTNLTLTGKQDVFFRYVTRLMLTLPAIEGRNATILDMLKLMHDPEPYARAIAALPDIPREFFARDFMSKSFEGTKEQVRYRLQAIIESPTMARLFTAPETKVDFFTEMNRGAVILVDTAKDFLKEGSAIFGKLMLSLILQAVLERAAIPEAKRKPTFLMVDEAGSFFSNNIDDLLTEARKYKCGLLLAHQYLDQATTSLRASLAANAGIKFASGLSAQDAATMARDMRTTPDFVLAQPRLQFAAHVRNVTPAAVSVPVSPLLKPPQLSEGAFQDLVRRNRERVSLPESSRAANSAPAPGTSEDISVNW